MTERMTAAEYQAHNQPAPPSKYGNQVAMVNGIKFDSKREAARYVLLRQWERSGKISDLELQVKIKLRGEKGPMLTKTGRQMLYVADFAYREAETGLYVLEDSKGHATKEYLVKAAAVRAMGMELREV